MSSNKLLPGTDASRIIDDEMPRAVPVSVLDYNNDEFVQRAVNAIRPTVVANPQQFGVSSAQEFDQKFELGSVERLYAHTAQPPHNDAGDGFVQIRTFQNGAHLWAVGTHFICRTHAGATLTSFEDIDTYLLVTDAWAHGDRERDEFLRLAVRNPA